MTSQNGLKDIIGVSPHIEELRREIAYVANEDSTVLIQGPTGTGKELVANNIHHKSKRKDYKFVIINCSAIPSELLESELFGHMKGSFSQAIRDKRGLIETADGGTLFLDEIGDLHPTHQAKILRFLEDRSFVKVGDTKEKNVDVRVIAATNKDLFKEVKNKTFREDLYYRLNHHEIYTSALEYRYQDTVCLVNHFFESPLLTIEEAKRRFLLYAHTFPGNVRELENLKGKPLNTIIKKMLRYWENRFPILAEPDEYLRMYFSNLIVTQRMYLYDIAKKFDCNPEDKAKLVPVRRWMDFRDAYRLVREKDDIKKRVRAYEIITLYQNTTLSKKDIAKTLKIRFDKLSPGKFRSRFGFEFPNREDPYLIFRHPMDAYPSPITATNHIKKLEHQKKKKEDRKLKLLFPTLDLP